MSSRTFVTLCGSTRFKEEFESAMARETEAGKIVLTVGRFGHRDGLDMSSDLKRHLDQLHLDKIEASHEVLVIDVGGYIGESTRREIDFAISLGRKVRYLSKGE